MSQIRSEPHIEIFSDQDALAREAAKFFAHWAKEAVEQRGRFSAVLSGGSTPQRLFSLLAQPPYANELPWTSIHFFWGDERLVPPDDSGSNYYHAAKLLLDHVPVPSQNIHRIKGEIAADMALRDAIDQMQAYASGSRQWPRFDLVLMGMGSDGHTASLFPGSPPNEGPGVIAKTVTAEYENRPSARLTLTPLVINDARSILFLVTGRSKAQALAAVLTGPQDLEKWPAQRIRPHSGSLTWFVDREAAANLEQI